MFELQQRLGKQYERQFNISDGCTSGAVIGFPSYEQKRERVGVIVVVVYAFEGFNFGGRYYESALQARRLADVRSFYLQRMGISIHSGIVSERRGHQ